MSERAREAIAAGRQLIIFPEERGVRPVRLPITNPASPIFTRPRGRPACRSLSTRGPIGRGGRSFDGRAPLRSGEILTPSGPACVRRPFLPSFGRGRSGLYASLRRGPARDRQVSSIDEALGAAPAGPRAAARRSRPSRSPRLVRPASSGTPLARGAWRAHGPLPRVAFGDHAAADDRHDRRPVFRALHGAVSDRPGTRRGAARGRARDVGGARLLQPRAQAACLRHRRREA